VRLMMATILTIALPAAAAAQSSAASPDGRLPPIGLPHPPIGLPLPQIGLPLPPIGTWPPADPRPRPDVRDGRFQRAPERRIPDEPHRRHHRRGGRSSDRVPPLVYVVPVYPWGETQSVQTPGATPHALPPSTPQNGVSDRREPTPPVGTLRLEIEPRELAQIYVDGYYVGTLTDVDGELQLEAGAHRLEVRASGHKALVVEVKVPEGRSISYRGVLERDVASADPDPAPPPDAVRKAPETFYLIPGCYAGNVPPKDAGLPASCDPDKVITVTH
jgi:hypothetical protein